MDSCRDGGSHRASPAGLYRGSWLPCLDWSSLVVDSYRGSTSGSGQLGIVSSKEGPGCSLDISGVRNLVEALDTGGDGGCNWSSPFLLYSGDRSWYMVGIYCSMVYTCWDSVGHRAGPSRLLLNMDGLLG